MKMNKTLANRVLIATAIAFLIVAALDIRYSNIWLDWLLFVVEAVLVGGIADWFAVTALFEKPLGFPYHTALLPKGKEKFATSCSNVIKKEFMDDRFLCKTVKESDILNKFIGETELKKAEKQDKLIRNIIDFLVKEIKDVDDYSIGKIASSLYPDAVKAMNEKSLSELVKEFSELDKDSQSDKEKVIEKKTKAIKKGAKSLNTFFDKEEGEKYLVDFITSSLHDVENTGVINKIGINVGKFFNTINEEDLARVIAQRIKEVCNEIQKGDKEITADLLKLFDELIENIREDEKFIEVLADLRSDFSSSNTLEQIIYRGLQNLKRHFVDDVSDKNTLHKLVRDILKKELNHCIDKINSDESFKHKIELLVVDFTKYGAFAVRDLLLETLTNSLKGLSDEELNKIVYSKVERELTFIRLNGSVVGGVIGIFGFWIVHFISG